MSDVCRPTSALPILDLSSSSSDSSIPEVCSARSSSALPELIIDSSSESSSEYSSSTSGFFSDPCTQDSPLSTPANSTSNSSLASESEHGSIAPLEESVSDSQSWVRTDETGSESTTAESWHTAFSASSLNESSEELLNLTDELNKLTVSSETSSVSDVGINIDDEGEVSI